MPGPARSLAAVRGGTLLQLEVFEQTGESAAATAGCADQKKGPT